jgi:non-specific serine/threonine protein kinase
MRARGLWLRAFARWLQHDLPQVIAHTKEALRLNGALHDQVGVAWCVEMLAWVAAAEDDAQRAAVLFGMGDTLWEQIGGWLSGWGTVREVSSQCRAKARDALGQPAFEAAVQRGKSFTLDEAVAYALGEQPTPPPAASPAAPELTQLTRREREVATLVARGMSNKDVAAKLVIAQRTAEAHVEHILTKLGFTSRNQITAWIAEQQDS